MIFAKCNGALWSAVAIALTPAAFASSPPPIDFSYCGYANASEPLPDSASIPVRATLSPSGGDDTAAIQRALDAGFHGAVLLRPGIYKIGGTLKLTASGVVLRGDGNATLHATGIQRRLVIVVEGAANRKLLDTAIAVDTAAQSVATGARTLPLKNIDALAPGDRVLIRRPCTKEWITAIGMDSVKKGFAERVNWTQGTRDVVWDRTIVAVDRNTRTITLDAPLTLALEKKYGGATVQKYDWPGRISRVGIENLTITSDSDASNPKDEEHAWFGIMLDNIEDAWVRGVTTRGLVSAGVVIGANASAITVENCRVEAPVAEAGGWRRLGIWNNGQLVLVRNCTVEQSFHGLATALCAAGPNVYLDCTAQDALADVTPFESLSTGTLYDNVTVHGAGVGFTLGNIGDFAMHGAGWNAANCVIWNCTAENTRIESAPGTENIAKNDPQIPSLYREQLKQRTVAQAAKPAPSSKNPSKPNRPRHAAKQQPPPTFDIRNAHLLVNGRAIFGTGATTPWWKGDMFPKDTSRRVNVEQPTLWAPGRTGVTPPLEDVAKQFAASDSSIYFYCWGLWYDRRREAHDLASHTSPEVCAPFYEWPWARSGQGQANDGLSKYDLEKFNPWYWSRLSESAQACAKQGLFFMNHFYNGHSLIEAGAHWVDFPWSPGNAIQDLGFPRVGDDKRCRFANEFFDITRPELRALHHLYIRKGLDTFKGQPNVIHTVGFQHVSSLEFVQFFLDTVAEWKRETGTDVRLAVISAKEQTDAILSMPKYAAMIDVIDLSYWKYLADGSLFAPKAGQNKAFREMTYEAFPKGKGDVTPSTEALLYQQVREYRDRFPDKAILCPPHTTAAAITVLMAGGASLAPANILGRGEKAESNPKKNRDAGLYAFIRDTVGSSLEKMCPLDDIADVWCLGDGNKAWLFYSPKGDAISLKKSASLKNCTIAIWYDPAKNRTQRAPLQSCLLGQTIKKPGAGAWLLFVE